MCKMQCDTTAGSSQCSST